MPLKISLYSFTIAIPILALYLLNLVAAAQFTYHELTWYNGLAFAGGVLSSLLGFAAMFWHFSRITGLLFTFLSIAGFPAVVHFHARLKAINGDRHK